MKTVHTQEQKATLNKMVQLLDIFRTLDPLTDTTIGEAVALLNIAISEQKNGDAITITELSEKSGFSLASSSRYVKSLSTQDRQGREGLGLVDSSRDPLNDRRKLLTITPEGAKVLSKVIKIMESK